MTTKTTGSEWKRFYDDKEAWPGEAGDVYHEDEELTLNGKEVDYDTFDPEKLADSDILTVRGGIVFGVRGEPSLESYFKAWRKKQSTVSFVVECDRNMEPIVRSAIAAAMAVHAGVKK